MRFNPSSVFLFSLMLLLLGNNTAVAWHQLEHLETDTHFSSEHNDVDELCDDPSHLQGSSTVNQFQFCLASSSAQLIAQKTSESFLSLNARNYVIRAPPVH